MHRWVHNTELDLKEVGWDGMDWTNLAQDWDSWQTVLNMAINLLSSIKCMELSD
jgi:hypothetical protein